jgi:BlaI family transcriptional regulator, penicillinase repressor
MTQNQHEQLSRRERQIMDILYRRGEATVAEVLQELADPPSYSTVRALMRILEEKGHLVHREEGPRYIYAPSVSKDRAQRSMLQSLLTNFFGGSREKLLAALLDDADGELHPKELENLSELIDQARKEGR